MLTIVVPVFNEAGSLIELHRQLAAALDPLDEDSEIIFVDDGSTDEGPAILERLAAGDSRIRVLTFRRNYGKSAALDAGFRHAEGQTIVTLDSDLQDDPSELPRFLAKLDEDFDVVSGWKRVREDPIDKTLPSRIFNGFLRLVSRLDIHDFNCGFKAYRRESIEGLRLYGELHRFIPALLHWDGFRIAEIEVTHHPRTSGRSKFGARRILSGAFDLLTVLLISRFRSRPLHFFGYIALVLGTIGSLMLIYLFTLSVFGIDPMRPRPMLYASMLLILSSLLLISTGLLGELMKSLVLSGQPDYLIIEKPPRPPDQHRDKASPTARTK